ncbi:MAG: AzlD domain-containing protein [Pseudorhodobacter sp.]
MIDDTIFWIVTILLGIGTWLIRFSFLGFLGGRALPDWVLVHLRYVGIGVLPALAAPLVVWPPTMGGAVDMLRIMAAAIALYAGWRFGVIASIVTGIGSLWFLQWIIG